MGYSKTAGVRLIQSLLTTGDTPKAIFTMAEAREAGMRVDVSGDYIRGVLSMLQRSGQVQRVRRGLYVMSECCTGYRVPEVAVATRISEPSAVSHWSAMNHHGLTEQISRFIHVMTSEFVETPSMRKQKTALDSQEDEPARLSGKKHFFQFQNIPIYLHGADKELFFGIAEETIAGLFRVPFLDMERTVLDGFIFQKRYGGLANVLEILRTKLATDRRQNGLSAEKPLDIPKLARYAIRYGRASVVKRLGWSLDHLGSCDRGSLRMLEDFPCEAYIPLDTSKPDRRGKCTSKWMVIENIIEPGRMPEEGIER